MVASRRHATVSLVALQKSNRVGAPPFPHIRLTAVHIKDGRGSQRRRLSLRAALLRRKGMSITSGIPDSSVLREDKDADEVRRET